ncbi:MAG: hypothetical protein CVT63_02680 [Candidatus Anoxymicrobium japonicum]|uniref:UVR domain-containing protein n=1 Tax=Candidatus Anoxymicrobium japonicum TaxID=2013648 RepID=A0A2N3G6X3_9ACTN|nr:MAG: hypothetical protein CVT63_02680 [Candidatus Anoxymicrobium japonicum]
MNIFCDECKRNIATVFLTRISSNEISKAQFCEKCANRIEETAEAANLFAVLPHILSGAREMDEPVAEDALSSAIITCETCGTSFNDFQKMGFLGCSHCYEAFRELLDKVLLEFQGATEHVGKIPGKASKSARLRKRLLELEHHLERQVTQEEYEAAAAARDKIKKIKGELDMDKDSGAK